MNPHRDDPGRAMPARDLWALLDLYRSHIGSWWAGQMRRRAYRRNRCPYCRLPLRLRVALPGDAAAKGCQNGHVIFAAH